MGRRLLVLLLLLAACEKSDGSASDDGGAGGSGGVGGLGGAGGEETGPVVLLIHDRSGSMRNCFGAGGGGGCDSDGDGRLDADGPSRLERSREAVVELVESASAVRFGLVLPGAGETECGPAVLEVAPAAGSNDSVLAAYAGSPSLQRPFGPTPIVDALELALEPLAADLHGGREKFVLLLTDGLMNCNAEHPVPCACADAMCPVDGGGTVTSGESGALLVPEMCLDDDRAVAAMRALRAAGVRTAVVGIGDGFGWGGFAAEALHRVAAEGGLDAGEHKAFYGAATPAELEASLATIRDRILGL